MKSFEHCYSKNELNKISSTFFELVITGIEHLFAQNDRSVIKRATDSTRSTASGQIDITSGQTQITTIGQMSTTSDQAKHDHYKLLRVT